MKRFIATCVLGLFFSCRAFAAASGTSSTEPVKATLISEEKAVQPGKPFWVGVLLEIQEGWDTYWINPGEAGLPTKILWQLPDGYQAGPVHWPAPEEFSAQDLKAFGYTHSVLLMSEITPPSVGSLKEVPIGAEVSWLACKDACVPGEAKLSLKLPVKELSEKDPLVSALFKEARDLLPQAHSGELSLAQESEQLVLHFSSTQGLLSEESIAKAYFFPETRELLDYHAPQLLEKASKSYQLNLPLSDSSSLPDRVKGVLVVEGIDSSSQVIAVDLPIKAGSSLFSLKFLAALVAAFFGGLILNVMPCVLPVIALKVMSFVKMAGERRSELFKHSGAFTMGVLVSFWALTALLFLLRAAGSHIGWGFQLQEPIFVALLVALLFVFGLSLFGLFEMGASLTALAEKAKDKRPLGKAFFNGILATLVATPCTGPLLGSALGFAITLPFMHSFIIFTAMALGMALPYFIFALFPTLLRFMPKPGAWMNTFKQLMGFLMMGSALWLLWVFAAQTGTLATFVLLAALLILSLASWIFGYWGSPRFRKPVRRIATLGALALLIVAGSAIFKAPALAEMGPKSELASDSSAWQAYTPERVKELRGEGKAVFVDFTAKWCLICQTNKIALHASEVSQSFSDHNVVALEADWTKKSPEITQTLHALGRTGVPVYVLYPADPEAEPIILPQTLTKSVVLDYLEKLSP